ncbi:MAG: hypothetical protein AB8H03_15450 [Saprospiraceae bacterium]
MIFKQKFLAHLLRCLKDSEYLLFEHFAIYKSIPEIPFNILLRKKDHQQVVDSIKTFSEIGIVSASQKGAYTEFQIAFKEGTKVQLNLWENLSYGNMTFMNIEKVFLKRQRSKSEFYMPNIEDLFEFAVLYHYLNNQGLPIQYLNYFEDFHFFVKDGLLEFFNHKYQTNFSNLDGLSNFDLKIKESIVDELKKAPNNQFFKKINMQWRNLFTSP